MLAQGLAVHRVAAACNVTERTLYRWKADMEFSAEVDRLSHRLSIATRAASLRHAMRIIRQKTAVLTVRSRRANTRWT